MATEIEWVDLKKAKVKIEPEEDIFKDNEQLHEVIFRTMKKLDNISPMNDRSKSDEVLAKYIEDADKQIDIIKDKFMKGFGQMYKGVLVANKLSIREDGGVYRYRAQWKMELTSALMELLIINRTQIMGNLGVERGNILFEILDKIYVKEASGIHKNILKADWNDAEGVKGIKPIWLFDFDNKSWRDSSRLEPRGEMIQVSQFKYSQGRIDFENSDSDSLKNSQLHTLCLKRYEKEIKELREIIISNLNKTKSELDVIEKLITDRMGKYILVAGLKDA